ncbi:MAG: hypothetical protein M3N14_02715 [Bacteroidota bacterium]|nr:hypothetical protein [Bacteroidota bacterium]
MKKVIYILMLLMSASLRGAHAQGSVLDLGVRLQKTVNLYSENGVAVSYSDKGLLADRLYFGASYATTRLGTAFHSNAIKQDNYLVSAAWYFRRNRVIRPFVRANGGYFSADYGSKIFDVLPRSSALLSSDVGISFQTGLPVKIGTSLGYNFITGNGLSGPGTLYPVFYQLTVSWNIFDHTKINHHVRPARTLNL